MLTLPTPGKDLRQSAGAPARQVSLRADLDYAAHHVRAQETITYPNRTGVALPRLAFDVLAARRPGVFMLTAGNVQNDPTSTFTLKGAVLQVALSQPLAADAVAVVAIEYTLDLPPILREADGTTGDAGLEHPPDEPGRLVPGSVGLPWRMGRRTQPASRRGRDDCT